MPYLRAYDSIDGRSQSAKALRDRAAIGETALDCRESAGLAYEHAVSRVYEFDVEDCIVSRCQRGELLGPLDFDSLD